MTPRVPSSTHDDPLDLLLATKLYKPVPRAQLVRRSHLVERLTQGVAGPFTLISAPAGFGKTTLLAQWLAESGMPIAWLSLEAEDNEPIRFLSYLIAALQTLDDSLGSAALSLLRTPQPPALERVLKLLLNDLGSRGGETFYLVLDDYHVITDESIHRTLTFLLEHLPPCMHLILATRADPPVPLARLRARGHLLELRAADLRFSSEEASAFLSTIMGLDLSPQALETLESRTEGWIAGLQLAALSLQGRPDVASFLSAFSGSHRFVLDYLTDEVLARQPAAVQSFLLHTSILERLSGSLCERLTGLKGGQAMLEALDRDNLFVVSLDEERRWYRYHHLFAEVLRSRLQRAERALVPELHRRAGVWYEQHELFIEAIQHALLAPDLAYAAHLIERIGLSIVLRGEVQLVLDWLIALPDTLVRVNPTLCWIHAIALMNTNELEAAEARLQDAERCLQADAPVEQMRTMRGQIATSRSTIARYRGDLARCIALSREALDLLPETPSTLISRVSALLHTTLAFLVNGEASPALESTVIAAAAPALASGNRITHLRSITLLARLQMLQGRLRQAAMTYEQTVQIAPGQEGLRLLVGSPAYSFGLGHLLCEWNELEAAGRHVARGMELVKGTLTVDAHEIVLGYTTQARLHLARGDYREALASLDAFRHFAQQRHLAPHWMAHTEAVRAQLELAQGNLAAGAHWADTSGLSPTDEDLSYLHEREYLTLARVRLAQGRADPAGLFLPDALRLLDRLLSDAEAKARMGSALEILVLRALALHVQHKEAGALTTLERALTLAAPEGYIRLFVDEGTPMLALLQRVQARGSASEYIAKLLSGFGEPMSAAAFPPTPLPGGLVEPLSERELDVLRLLVAGLSNSAIAQELIITVGTVKRHVNSIYGKLGVQSRTQAVARTHTLHLL